MPKSYTPLSECHSKMSLSPPLHSNEPALLHHNTCLCSSHSRPPEGRERTFIASNYPSFQHVVGPEQLLVEQKVPGYHILEDIATDNLGF